MSKRRSAGSVVARICLVLALLAGGVFLAWRLYNYSSVKTITKIEGTALEGVTKQTELPYSYDSENKLLMVTLSDETLNAFFTETCENNRVLSVEILVSKQMVRMVVLSDTNEQILLNAHMSLSERGNRLVLQLTNFTLGVANLPVIGLGIHVSDFEELMFDASKAIPSFCSLQSIRMASDNTLLSLNVNLADFRIFLKDYLHATSDFFIFLAKKSDNCRLSDLYLEGCTTSSVSLELAEEVLSAVFEHGVEREAFSATVAAFEENMYQSVLNLLNQYLPQTGLVKKISAYRLTYKTEACEDVANHYLALLKADFVDESIHACVYYPYRASNGKIYDGDWVSANKPGNILYADYCEARLYYDESVGEVLVFIQMPDEDKIFYSNGLQSAVAQKEELNKYDRLYDTAVRAVSVTKESDVSCIKALRQLLEDYYAGFSVNIRYLSQTAEEIFAVYTIDQSLTLRGAYFTIQDGQLSLVSADIGRYADFAKENSHVNYTLFPLEEYAGKTLTAVSNQTLNEIQTRLTEMGGMAEEDYFVYYSCYDQWFYYETSAGLRGLIGVESGKTNPIVSEFSTLLEK